MPSSIGTDLGQGLHSDTAFREFGCGIWGQGLGVEVCVIGFRLNFKLGFEFSFGLELRWGTVRVGLV